MLQKPTTVNYCCNNLLPVAKGSSPGFFTSLLDISLIEGRGYLCDPQHCASAKLLGGRAEGKEARKGRCLLLAQAIPNLSTISPWWLTNLCQSQHCWQGFPGTLVYAAWTVLFPSVCLLVVSTAICRSPEVFKALLA